jgi:hypothetical protein
MRRLWIGSKESIHFKMKKKYALTSPSSLRGRLGSHKVAAAAIAAGLATLAGTASVYAGDYDKKEVAPPPIQPAASNEESIDDAWWTGPLVAPNPTALPVGTFLAEPYFTGNINYGQYGSGWGMSRKPNSYSAGTAWLLEYGLLPNFSLSVLPGASYGWNHGGDSSSIQFTDLQVRVQYMFHKFKGKGDLWPTISLEVGEIFPTGQYSNLSSGEDGVGNGVYSTRLGLWTQYYYWLPNGRILRQRFDVIANIPTGNAKLHNLSSYNTPQGFNGHVSAGNSYTFDLAYEYSLTSHWVPAIDFVYIHGDRNEVSGIQRVGSGLASYNQAYGKGGPSTEYFEVDPAIEYNFNDRYGIIAGAEIAVGGRNTTATVIPQVAINMVF